MNEASSAGIAGGEQIRVFLVDDHEVVRRGVRNILDAEPDTEVRRRERHDPGIALAQVAAPDRCRRLDVTARRRQRVTAVRLAAYGMPYAHLV